ncbi:MAG TPA: hypothetical protein VGD17_19655, partial [Chitinophagaceae bacterium]
VFIGSSIKLAPMILDNQAVKLNAFTQLTYFTSNKIDFTVMPQLFYARLKDRAATIDGFGFAIDASPFIIGRNWTNGLILGWQHTALAHIKHSEATRETFSDRYPSTDKDGPRDGWYRATANRFKLGYTTARAITNRGTIQLSAGGMINRQKQGILLGFSHAQVPFFIEGSFRYKFEK